MFDLLNININKRLSFISLIFIIISLIMIFFLLYYHASFEISMFELLDNKEIIVQNYYIDSLQTIEITGVIFIIFCESCYYAKKCKLFCKKLLTTQKVCDILLKLPQKKTAAHGH